MRKVRYNLFPVEMPSVNASELSQGHAAKIINKIHNNKVDTVVMKNNKPFVVIMEYSEYIKNQKQYVRDRHIKSNKATVHKTNCRCKKAYNKR